MTLNQIIEKIIAKFGALLSAELDGKINGHYDEEKNVACFSGHCNKVHPDLKNVYPNGWTMCQDYTIDEMLKRLGLTLELRPAPR